MKLLYLGNFGPSWSSENHITRDAERIPGVEVTFVQEEDSRKTPKQAMRELHRIEEAVALVDADLLIYQRTWGLHPDATELWRKLEANGCQTASYHLDLYVGLDREKTIAGDPFWSTGVVFTADGDPHTTEVLAGMGIDHRWLPAACVSDECVPGRKIDGLPDIAFVGSVAGSYHHEWPWRGELLDALAKRYGNRFRRYPIDGQRLHGTKLNDLYASVPVIIGDSLALPGHRDYWSDRFYETVGRGGYLIGPDVDGIEAHFTSGEHLDLYDIGDLNHVFELVDQALADPEGSRAIAMNGQAHVRAHHTYTHRVRAMLDALGLTP